MNLTLSRFFEMQSAGEKTFEKNMFLNNSMVSLDFN